MTKKDNIQLDTDFFENIIIYHALTQEGYLSAILDYLKPEYFKNTDIQNIIGIISTFYQKRNCCPTLTEIKQYLVSDQLKESFKKVVNNFKNIDKKGNQTELIENTEKFFKERAIYNTMLEVADDCSRGKIDTSYILERFEKSCNILLTQDLGHDYFKDLEKHITDLQNQDSTISTGWKWLDKQLDGGFLLNGKSLTVIAGETNVGKSIVLSNLAKNIAQQNKSVVIISLEMSELVYSKRLSSAMFNIPIRELRHSTEELKKSINDFRLKNPKAAIYVKEFPPSTISPNHINAYLKKLTEQGIKIDVIIIDYLTLLTITMGNNSYEKGKYIVEQVRALSYVYNCPIISAGQLNRCLTLDTKVITQCGTKMLHNIRKGDLILGMKKFVCVRHVFPIQKQKIYIIRTASGKIIKCSKNHLFPTNKGIMSINTGLKKGVKLYSLSDSRL